MIVALEDSELRLRVLRRTVKPRKVVAFDRVQSFLAFTGQLLERPDLIVLDCHVLEGTGVDAARHLPSRYGSVPVLVWSDDADCANSMVELLVSRGWLAPVTYVPFGAATASAVRTLLER